MRGRQFSTGGASEADISREPLVQIWVDENHPNLGKRHIPIGPRMLRRFLEPLMTQINKAIAEGREKQWSNPHFEQVVLLQHESPFTAEDRANDRVGGHRYVKPSAGSGLVI